MSLRQTRSESRPSALRQVQLIDTAWVALEDGVRLAARIWLPRDACARPVGAIVDWVPYRRSDGTAIGDAAWGNYFAARGFAFVRPDVRGSGDSEGIMADEYSEREQEDCGQLLAWLAAQRWCHGAVGMIGISWGAFAALQQACRAPEQLRGVVAIHGSDDRYADDVHYIGGCLSALDMTQWATSMLAYLNQPPDPRVVGERWREAWLARLRHATPFYVHWLAHQRRDEYWRQGSACERYEQISCPLFVVGGWSDGYRDMVLRVLEHVRGPVRGLIGPWGHTSPERGLPGPAIGFLQECVRFFEATLNGADNGFFDEPRLISWMQEAVPPAGCYEQRPGRWVAEPSWPSPNVEEWVLAAGAGGLGESPPLPAARELRSPLATGLEGGVWCGDGGPADAPLDQRPDDSGSLCFDSEPLTERVELLGRCRARLLVSVDRPQAMLAVRVCDVAPDGASTLIARGVLNLSRREGCEHSAPMPVAQPVEVTVQTQSVAYAIPPGHRLRLAVSTNYWPWVWPAPEPVTLTLHCGPRCQLSLPRRRSGRLDEPAPRFAGPERGAPLAGQLITRGPGGRSVSRDLASGALELRFDWHDSRERIIDTATDIGEQNVAVYRIVEGQPLSARVQCRVRTLIEREHWRTEVVAQSTITCDKQRFLVTSSLEAFDDGVRVHAATHVHSFARDGN